MAHGADNFERSYIFYIENIMFSIDEKNFFSLGFGIAQSFSIFYSVMDRAPYFLLG